MAITTVKSLKSNNNSGTYTFTIVENDPVKIGENQYSIQFDTKIEYSITGTYKDNPKIGFFIGTDSNLANIKTPPNDQLSDPNGPLSRTRIGITIPDFPNLYDIRLHNQITNWNSFTSVMNTYPNTISHVAILDGSTTTYTGSKTGSFTRIINNAGSQIQSINIYYGAVVQSTHYADDTGFEPDLAVHNTGSSAAINLYFAPKDADITFVSSTNNSITLKPTWTSGMYPSIETATIQVSTTSNFSNIVKTVTGNKNTAITINGLDSNSKYYYRVSINDTKTTINTNNKEQSCWTLPEANNVVVTLKSGSEYNTINVSGSVSIASSYDQYRFKLGSNGTWSSWSSTKYVSYPNLVENTLYTVYMEMKNTNSGYVISNNGSATTWYNPLTDFIINLKDVWFWYLAINCSYAYSGNIVKYEFAIGDESFKNTGTNYHSRGTRNINDYFNNSVEKLKYNTDYSCKVRLTDNHNRTYTTSTTFRTYDERPFYVNNNLKEVKVIKSNGTVAPITPDLVTVLKSNNNIITMNEIINNIHMVSLENIQIQLNDIFNGDANAIVSKNISYDNYIIDTSDTTEYIINRLQTDICNIFNGDTNVIISEEIDNNYSKTIDASNPYTAIKSLQSEIDDINMGNTNVAVYDRRLYLLYDIQNQLDDIFAGSTDVVVSKDVNYTKYTITNSKADNITISNDSTIISLIKNFRNDISNIFNGKTNVAIRTDNSTALDTMTDDIDYEINNLQSIINSILHGYTTVITSTLHYVDILQNMQTQLDDIIDGHTNVAVSKEIPCNHCELDKVDTVENIINLLHTEINNITSGNTNVIISEEINYNCKKSINNNNIDIAINELQSDIYDIISGTTNVVASNHTVLQ